MNDIDEEKQGVIERVEKLLRLAAKNPNEHEAATATAKAQELLAAYNLDLAAVDEHGQDSGGKRMAEAMEGGNHDWEQALWKEVAELNFCMYWHQTDFLPTAMGRFKEWRNGKVIRGIYRHRHNIVGRKVNIAATNAMASYLQGTIERLTRERCVPAKIPLTGRWAMSFREGITFGVIGKIMDRRAAFIDEERKKARAAEEAAAKMATADASTSTALTLSTYVEEEHAKNYDFKHGEGAYAKILAQRAERARLKREAEEEYTRWAAENPKEAAKEEKRRQREMERNREKWRKENKYRGDPGAWRAGNDKAKGISLDPQAEHGGGNRKRLT